MQTVIGVGDPKAIKRYSIGLSTDTEKQSYFAGRFIGEGENNVIERKVDLEQDAGDRISFDLSMRLQGEGVDGDDNVEGTEENLTFYTDEVRIDQKRKGVDAGGRMSRKRTLHDLRDTAKARGAEWAAEWFDELIFVYLSGTLAGINEDRKVAREFAGNPIQAPDAYHQVYAGAATSKATLTAADKMNRDLVERISVMPRMMNSLNPNVVKMSPINIEAGKHFIGLIYIEQHLACTIRPCVKTFVATVIRPVFAVIKQENAIFGYYGWRTTLGQCTVEIFTPRIN